MHIRLSIFIIFLFEVPCQAQISFPDTTMSLGNPFARRLYDSARNYQAPLYNGIQHTGYESRIKGTPYFLSPDWKNGSVFYDGMLYQNVPLHFDLVTEEVVVQSPNKFGINLFTPRVDYFQFGGHRFVNMNAPHLSLSPGFYDILVQGPITIIVKRHKRINETIIGIEAELEFVSEDNFYLLKDGKIHSIHNEEDILQYTGSYRKEIKKLLKKNRVRFKKEMESAIKQIAGYYNQQS